MIPTPLLTSRKRRTASGFNPATLNAALWWTAGPTWGFTDAAMTVPGGDASAIHTVSDRSGFGRNAVQATTGKRPTLRLVGGKWAIRTDGIDDYIRAVFSLTQPVTVFSVARLITTSVSGYIIDGASASDTLTHLQSPAAGDCRILVGGGGPGVTLGTTIRIVASVFNGASSRIRLNDGVAVTATAGAIAIPGVGIGGYGGAGATGDSNFTNADYHELIVLPQAVSVSDESNVRNYLNAQWGVY